MKEKLDISKISDRNKIVSYLREGKIGLLPTDTVYGICCRIDSKKSVERVFEIKKREKKKPFLILGSSINQLSKYIIESDRIKKITNKYWPGPLTVILNVKKEKVLSLVRANLETVAVRIPDYDELLEIISRLKVPIIAPSANLSGKLPQSELSKIDNKIIDAVDFVVQGECKIKEPSTIIDCSESKVRLMRKGPISIKL